MAQAPVLGRVYIDVPPFKPSTSGVLAAAQASGTLITVSDGDPAIRGYQFETDGVRQIVSVDYQDCLASATLAAFDGLDVVQSDQPFTVFAGYECNLATMKMADARTRSQRRLTNGETVAVERNLWVNTFPAAVDITPTPGTAVKPKQALGLAAEYAGANYAGVPFFHAGRRLSTFLGGENLIDDMNTAALKGGGVLVNGGGYVGNAHPTSTGAPAPSATQAWLYVTGRIILVRDQIQTFEGVDPSHNDSVVVSERTYIPAVESILAAILVDLS